MSRFILTILIFSVGHLLFALEISGVVTDQSGKALPDVMIFVEGSPIKTVTDKEGKFSFTGLEPGRYQIVAFYPEFKTLAQKVELANEPIVLRFALEELMTELATVTVENTRAEDMGINWLQSVTGSAIYEAKKTELIQLEGLIANKASNVSRQVYSRIPGLNIWESDGTGVQLGIGGRGLNPDRTSNFNVRQNGYDISADALGYPESYYTPPTQALENIEVVRGAAGLQYGSQFGGMVNFDFKEGPKDKKVDVNLTNTVGSFGLFNTFNSVGGTVGKVNYYGFYQYKRSDGWRPNSGLDQHNAFGSATYNFSPFLNVKFEHTHMNYLAQQPGGLTDSQFYQDPRQSNRERNWFQVGWDLSAMEWNYRVSSSLKFNNRTFHLGAKKYAVGNLEDIRKADDPETNRNLLMDNFNNWGNEFRAIIHYPLFDQKSVLLMGNRIYLGKTFRKQGEANNSYGPSFEFIKFDSAESSSYVFPGRNVAFFIENIFNLTPKFSVTPGFRYEYISTEAKGFYYFKRTDLAGNILAVPRKDEERIRERSIFLAGVGFSYKQSEKVELYANFSQNYRAINFNDIRVINPSLKVDENIQDESGFNADLGIRGSNQGLFSYDISMFYLSYNDRIGAIWEKGTASRFRTNIGDAGILGIETYIEGNLYKLLNSKPMDFDLTGFVNFAWITSKYLSSKETGVLGRKVELVPPVNLKTGLTFKYKDFGVSYLFTHLGQQFSDATNALAPISESDSPVVGTIPSYMVMDLSFCYKWKRFTFETGINNLTDEAYFTRRAAGYPGPGIIPSDGRSGYVTVGVNF